MKKETLLSAFLFASGCAGFFPTPPATVTLDQFPLRRFDRVDVGLYRSGQPSKEQLAKLVTTYGIRTVLKLNSGSDPALPGVSVLHHPLSATRKPSLKELEDILAVLDKSPRPLLIHCTHGEDRTGLVVALYQIRRGVPLETAYVDMVRHGFHPYSGVWAAWLDASGWEDGTGVKPWLRGGSEPSARSTPPHS